VFLISFKPRRQYKKEDLNGAPEMYPDKIEIFTDEPFLMAVFQSVLPG
jgi:hypothetical protein